MFNSLSSETIAVLTRGSDVICWGWLGSIIYPSSVITYSFFTAFLWYNILMELYIPLASSEHPAMVRIKILTVAIVTTEKMCSKLSAQRLDEVFSIFGLHDLLSSLFVQQEYSIHKKDTLCIATLSYWIISQIQALPSWCHSKPEKLLETQILRSQWGMYAFKSRLVI